MLPGDQAVCDFPEKWGDENENHDGDRQGYAAGATLILLLLLQHAMGTEDDAAGAVRNGAFAIGIAAGERGQQIGAGFRPRRGGIS